MLFTLFFADTLDVKRFAQVVLCQCSYGRASANVGGQNLPTSDVIYQSYRVRRISTLLKAFSMGTRRMQTRRNPPNPALCGWSGGHVHLTVNSVYYGTRTNQVHWLETDGRWAGDEREPGSRRYGARPSSMTLSSQNHVKAREPQNRGMYTASSTLPLRKNTCYTMCK